MQGWAQQGRALGGPLGLTAPHRGYCLLSWGRCGAGVFEELSRVPVVARAECLMLPPTDIESGRWAHLRPFNCVSPV